MAPRSARCVPPVFAARACLWRRPFTQPCRSRTVRVAPRHTPSFPARFRGARPGTQIALCAALPGRALRWKRKVATVGHETNERDEGMLERWTARIGVAAARLGRAQATRPWAFTLVAFGIGVAAIPSVAGLELDSDFQALLPENVPSVRDLDEIRARALGTATLTLAI